MVNRPRRTRSSNRNTLPHTRRSESEAPAPRDLRQLPQASERFESRHRLGEGGLGIVVSAQDKLLRREVALKFIKAESARVDDRFLEEAQITAQLQHPNIVPVYDLTTTPDGRRVLAMKPVKGRTLRQAIVDVHETTNGRGPGEHLRAMLDIFQGICHAIAYAHSRGVIHRDLKPANIMVGEFGEVLVMDWGLARPIDRDAVRQDSDDDVLVTDLNEETGPVTMRGAIRGTPGYLAPEQAMGLTDLDERADIYSLGGVLYTMLTARLPVTGDTPEDLIEATLRGRVVPPRQRLPKANIPRELDAIVRRAMSLRRKARFQSVHELQEEIDRFLDGQLVRCARYSPWQRVERAVRRHPTQATLVAASAFVLLLAGLTMSWLHASAVEAERAHEAARSAELEREAAAQRAAHAELEKQAATAAAALAEAQATEFHDAIRAIGDQAVEQARGVRAEFERRYREVNVNGGGLDRFFETVDRSQLIAWRDAYDRLFQLAELDAENTPVTAWDYVMRAALREGLDDKPGAVEDFTDAIRLDPSLAEAWRERGIVRMHLGEFEPGIADMTEAMRLKPSGHTAYQLALAWFQAGRPQRAAEMCERAVELGPVTWSMWFTMGNAWRDAGDVRRAHAAFSRAIEINPEQSEAWVNRGRANADLGNPQAAIEDYTAAVKADPQQFKAWSNRGQIHAQLGDEASALADYERALAINDQHAFTYNARALLYQNRGDTAQALADYDRALAADHTLWQAAANKAGLMFNTKRYAECIEAARLALRHCRSASARAQLGDVIRMAQRAQGG